MSGFTTGDRVRVDIPDETDPDHDRYHGLHATVVEVLEDDVSEITGDDHDAVIYRVELETEEMADFRWRDLRPPIE
jgi:hypothetical protein